ncbi:MutS-related protein [Mammaliicoccus vitulinus]|uniref:MutS-related protein n=1 Tax=Mammaliicoccus vitulinus TaxID=71237 RepID=UPI00248D379B|nr:hypothetical protein [Mammaliicoccus vitulinus]
MQAILFYLGVFVIIIAVFSILSITNRIKDKKKVKELWNTNSKWLNYTESFVYFDNFYNNLKTSNIDRSLEVDDITWNDLSLDKIFQNINYTFTSIGEELLYSTLRNIGNLNNINEKMISKFEDDDIFRKKTSLILSKLSKSTNSNTSKYFLKNNNPPIRKFNIYYIFLTLLPFLGVGILFFNLILGISIVFFSIITNMAISYKHKSDLEKEYSDLFYSLNILNTAKSLQYLMKHEDLDILFNFKNHKKMKFLSAFLLNDEADANNLALQILTGIKNAFLLDYHLFHYITGILDENSDMYEKCWYIVAKIDLNYSVAMWRKNLPYYSIPEQTNSENLVTESVYHPLLESPIGNDLSFHKDILLTGSNASGKSTFMKSIAINIILSNGLNTSTSKYLKYQQGKVMSSMDISDSILDGDSYFISEIKALKRIFNEIISEENYYYCFIDELLKGTNTKERISAADVILRDISSKSNVNLIAATHDIELTESLQHDMLMYHFSEVLEDEDIFFDYKIKEGPSRTSNAIELLRIYDFPTNIYEDAKNAYSEKYILNIL